MPRKPKKPCAYPGCPNLTYTKYCEAHKQYEPPLHHPGTDTGSFYRTAAWKAKRKSYLEDHPFCVMCGRPASIVDHVVPIRQGGEPLDDDNLQSLCWSCHSRKSIKDGSRYARKVYTY